MSKVIYLIGAGASYGTRNEKGYRMDRYSSGMPVVSEIYDCLDRFCMSFRPQYILSGIDTRPSHPHVYEEMKWLKDIAKENHTIDTYARMLHVHGPQEELDRMKRALSIFFTLIQSKEKRDLRYDSFMEAVVDQRGKMRPDVSVLSWNYDHQFEYAFHQFELSKTSESHQYKYANISCKGFTSQFIDYEDSNLVKLNGMAWFKPKHDRYLYEATDNTADRFEQMLRTNSFNAENFISYAWEEDNDFIEKVLPLTRDTETLVIIGYSLPDVNRIVDHRLISGMKNLKNVVIQDRNCEQIKGRFLDLLSDEKRSELENRIRFETNLSSFYIPLSLSL